MLHRENGIRKYHTSSAADLIKEVMDHYDITQADLADRIGVTQKNVSDILNKKRYLTEILALRIEEVMGISSQLLLSLDSNYKFAEARRRGEIDSGESKSPLFLKKYSWVTVRKTTSVN